MELGKLVEFIEGQRALRGMSKTELCAGVFSTQSYHLMLKGAKPGYDVMNDLLGKLGFKLIVVADI